MPHKENKNSTESLRSTIKINHFYYYFKKDEWEHDNVTNGSFVVVNDWKKIGGTLDE